MNVLLVFVATLAVGIRFQLPKQSLGFSATIASLSYWLSVEAQALGASVTEASFLAAFTVAMSSEVLARALKTPAPVLSIPGIIPLVPGSVAYRGVIHLVNGQEVEGMALAVKAVLIASGIASGLLLASAVSRRVFRSPPFTLS